MEERGGRMITINELSSFLSECLGIDILPDEYESNFGELGIDSLKVFTLIDKIENKYGIKLPDENLYEYYSVERIYKGLCDGNE